MSETCVCDSIERDGTAAAPPCHRGDEAARLIATSDRRIPHRPPADDRTAVDAYYGLEDERCDGDYTLRAYDVLRHGTRPAH
ncbi:MULTISPECIES: hypothetical protein [Streptomyces rochei group]|uniref:hypothetical protein n=1 Tax=Streptomyces rochei group TaxID=2867164 RepID=UPI0018771C0B|nr:hypothetical protein [Streptomyces plicatus]